MSQQLRIRRLEVALTPTQLVLRWLDEAHAHGSLEAYVASLLAQEDPELPLDRLVREATASALASARSRRRPEVDAAVRTALRETIFRYELVLRINSSAMEVLEREALVQAALSAHLALLASWRQHGSQTEPARLTGLSGIAVVRASSLEAVEGARRTIEEHYLDGRDALAPDAAAAWTALLKLARELAGQASVLVEAACVGTRGVADSDTRGQDAGDLADGVLDVARVAALRAVGEYDAAAVRAARGVGARAPERP